MLHLPAGLEKEARQNVWGAFRSRNGDAAATRPALPDRRPPAFSMGDPHACKALPLVITAAYLKLPLSSHQTFAAFEFRVTFPRIADAS
jgi:hypothetical protein